MLLVYDRVFSSRSVETLLALAGLASACLLALGALDYARQRALAVLGARLQARLECRLLEQAKARHDLANPVDAPTAALDNLRGFIHSSACLHVIDVLWLPLYAGVIFLLSPVLGAVAFLGLAVLVTLFFLGKIIARNAVADANNASEALATLTGRFRRTRQRLAGALLIPDFDKRWLAARQASRFGAVSAKNRAASFSMAMSTVRRLLSVAVLTVGAALVLRGDITVGGMIAAVVLVNRGVFPAIDFFRTIPALSLACRDWKTLSNALSMPLAATSSPNPIKAAPLLCLQGVSVRGDLTPRPVLQDITLRIEPGSLISIEGDPGSGKTLLSETLALARRPPEGDVLVQGVNDKALQPDKRGQVIGFVPETPVFLPGPLFEAILGPAPRRDEAVLGSVARAAGLHERIMALPRGYDTKITEDGLPLSRGDRERLALARALVARPRILIVDSPSAALIADFAAHPGGPLQQFLAAGNAMVLTTRCSVPLSLPQLCYRLSDGQLSELPGRARDALVLRSEASA